MASEYRSPGGARDLLDFAANVAGATDFQRAVEAVRAGASPSAEAERLVGELRERERLWLLDGDRGFWAGVADTVARGYGRRPYLAGRVRRLGIPGIRFTDGPRGVTLGSSTAFPVAMARGATWDPELEERVGDAIGREARAQGANFFAGVCINLLRHPAWGRAQETYGEDPLLLGRMGAALVRGTQRWLMACAKHYACNSMENARFTVDVRVSERDLHEVYLPHFRSAVEAGVTSVMTSYNRVNGSHAGESAELMTRIAREEWGFGGFFISDFVWGLRDPVASLEAGLDVEMPFRQQRAPALPRALRRGLLERRHVDEAARRIVATQLRHAAAVEPEAPPPSVVACPEHRALAREVAVRSIVLLRNQGALLPLEPGARVALLGRLADQPNLGDRGSSDVRPPQVVTIREGLAGRCALVDDPADADVAVVVAGLSHRDEGEFFVSGEDELRVFPAPAGLAPVRKLIHRLSWLGARQAGGDRRRLTLRPEDERLILATAAANPRTVVVLIGGSAILCEAWRERVAAILHAFYPGMEGGRALADVLFGDAEPGGRLPFAVPRSEEHLPFLDIDARAIDYDRWWGQRLLERDGHEPAFPLGFGLGYTDWALSGLEVGASLDRAAVRLRNAGGRRGGTVVQVYARPEDGVRALVGFARAELGPGEERIVEVELSARPLARREGPGRWTLPAGKYRYEAARFAGDPVAAAADVPVGASLAVA